jgi:hypothetical protein
MRGARTVRLLLLLISCAAAEARAADAPVAPPTKSFPALQAPELSHKFQFGLAVLPGFGYRFIVPYEDDAKCGEGDNRVCSGSLPVFLDVQPSFGFAHHWDILVDLRFGLGKDFTNTRQFAMAPGFRYWVSPHDNLKFFATIQAAYDVTTQNNAALKRNNDWALRNSNGFMYEVMRNLGLYIQFGETLGFVRWMRFEIDVGLGVQARLL